MSRASRWTVIVPAYNRAGLIAETMDRIVAQTLPAAAVIVVDDGSTDGTADVLARYGGAVRVIRVGNGGDLAARNLGLREARTDLVAFCDSDDLWEPGFLAAMDACWAQEPGLTACYGDFRTLQDGAVAETTKFSGAPPGYWAGMEVGAACGVLRSTYAERLLQFQPFFPSCMAASRAGLLALGGWDEGVTGLVGCDFATMLRVAMAPPVGVLRRPLVTIRKHSGNFSGDTERMNLGDALVLEHVLSTRAELAPFGAGNPGQCRPAAGRCAGQRVRSRRLPGRAGDLSLVAGGDQAVEGAAETRVGGAAGAGCAGVGAGRRAVGVSGLR